MFQDPNIPDGLGDLTLADVIAGNEAEVRRHDKLVMIGHSVGGLITQIMLNRGLLSAGVGQFGRAQRDDGPRLGFHQESAIIANPLMGNEPIRMDAKTFTAHSRTH